MANWFKLYETDLDETRLKYALSKLPEVGWIWIGILSECCKHRSDTLRWSDREHELFGFSDRLKVSLGKINEAINLLCEIEYIKRGEGVIKVLKWNDKQSEYCVRKDRGDYKKAAKSRIVSDNIGDSPLEERRGEENRGDRENDYPIGGTSNMSRNGTGEVPALEDCIAATMTAGIPEDFTRYVYEDWACRGGCDAAGHPVQFLRYVKKRWDREGQQWRAGKHKGKPAAAADDGMPPANCMTKAEREELKEREAAEVRRRIERRP